MRGFGCGCCLKQGWPAGGKILLAVMAGESIYANVRLRLRLIEPTGFSVESAAPTTAKKVGIPAAATNLAGALDHGFRVKVGDGAAIGNDQQHPLLGIEGNGGCQVNERYKRRVRRTPAHQPSAELPVLAITVRR